MSRKNLWKIRQKFLEKCQKEFIEIIPDNFFMRLSLKEFFYKNPSKNLLNWTWKSFCKSSMKILRSFRKESVEGFLKEYVEEFQQEFINKF